jgi:hypothetical protein
LLNQAKTLDFSYPELGFTQKSGTLSMDCSEETAALLLEQG